MKRLFILPGIILAIVLLLGCTADNNKEPIDDQNEISNSNEQIDNNYESQDNEDKIDKEDEKAHAIKDYFPIEENVRYDYEGEGNEYARYNVHVDYTAENQVQQRIDDGGTVLARVIELKYGKLIRKSFGEEVYYRENFLEADGGQEEVLLMEPIKEGTSWTLEDSRTRKITGVSVDVTTPLGDYQAIEVLTQDSESESYDYYVKDIGLVKSIFVAEGMEITSSLSQIHQDVPLTQTIKFYYPSIDDNKSYFEVKDVEFNTNDITRQVLETAYREKPKKDFLEVFSENTEINSLYLNEDGMVYIDLNKAFLKDMNAGAGYEAMMLQSIGNTFGKYYSSEKVILTIDDQLYESGHISMEKGEYIQVDQEDGLEIE